MIRALIKKQLLELAASLVKNRKSERKNGAGPIVLLIVLFSLIFVSVGFSIFMLTGFFFELSSEAAQAGQDVNWLFFAFFGLLAFIVGLVGSVFMTYQTLYGAKDNDLLLSMPIPPSFILLARSVGLYIFTLIFEAIVLIPTEIRFIVSVGFSLPQVLMTLAEIVFLPLFTFVFSALFGYIVALIAPKIKNKSLVSVVMTVLFLAAYLAAYMNFQTIMKEMIAGAAEAEPVIMRALFPFYALGKGLSGEKPWLFAVFALIALSAFALVYLLLSKSFFRLATTPTQGVKRTYNGEIGRQTPIKKALLKKEFACFKNCPSYILNTMIGVAALFAAFIAQFFGREAMKSVFGSIAIFGIPVFPVLLCAGIALFGGMGCTTSPSISLEGQALPILRSLPVRAEAILHAKLKMHVILIVLPTFICHAGICLSLIEPLPAAILSAVVPLPVFWASGVFGLIFNLKHPFLDWSSEAVAIKQSGSTVLTMLSTVAEVMIGSTLAAGAAFLLESLYAALTVMLVFFTAVAVVFTVLLERWGVKQFDKL